MDYIKSIVSNQKEESISIQRANSKWNAPVIVTAYLKSF